MNLEQEDNKVFNVNFKAFNPHRTNMFSLEFYNEHDERLLTNQLELSILEFNFPQLNISESGPEVERFQSFQFMALLDEQFNTLRCIKNLFNKKINVRINYYGVSGIEINHFLIRNCDIRSVKFSNLNLNSLNSTSSVIVDFLVILNCELRKI